MIGTSGKSYTYKVGQGTINFPPGEFNVQKMHYTLQI